MDSKKLYKELCKIKYSKYPFNRLKNWGEDMEIVEEVIANYWRQRFLIDHETNDAYELMDSSLTLKFVKPCDVDWKDVETLENNLNAYSFSAHYPIFSVGKFANGVALVKWTLYPDGRYFMDEDGFGMESNSESVLHGFIDRCARVVIPFQAKGIQEILERRTEAELRAKAFPCH